MEALEFYQLLGQITYSFGKIDFLISNIAVDLKMVKSYQPFLAKTNFAKKTKSLKEVIIASDITSDIQSKLINTLDRLEELRIIRNMLTHSIIMKNANTTEEYVLYNYINVGDGRIDRTVITYSGEDIQKINTDFITLHNDIYSVWQKLKSSLNALRLE